MSAATSAEVQIMMATTGERCKRCDAPVANDDKPAVLGRPEVCYWAAGQRSENAYDSCARRALARLQQIEADYRARCSGPIAKRPMRSALTLAIALGCERASRHMQLQC